MADLEANKIGFIKGAIDAVKTVYLGLMPHSLYATAIIGAGILLAVFLFWLFSQSDSKNEIKADDARSNVQMQSANTSVANAQLERVDESVEASGKQSQSAVNKAKKTREKVKSNSNLDDAMRLCVEAYGEENCR